jgi:hypothetical protein
MPWYVFDLEHIHIKGITNCEFLIQASIIGKRVGRYRWSPTTSKTLEGSAGFTISVVASAWVLRLCGLVEEFSVSEFTVKRRCQLMLLD